MTTTANYILTATVDGQEHIFEYEDTMDVWQTLEEFYSSDYSETIANRAGSGEFPVEVKAMHNGKVITTYRLKFNGCVFDHFFAKGWKATAAWGADFGAIRGDNNGIQLTLSKTGIISTRR